MTRFTRCPGCSQCLGAEFVMILRNEQGAMTLHTLPLQEFGEAAHVLADSESSRGVTTQLYLAKRLADVIWAG